MSEVYEKAYAQAHAIAHAAALKAVPAVMVVEEVVGPNPGQRWVEPEGACGFAWIKVRPGNSSFAKWCVKNKNAHKAYDGGVDIWVGDYNQSYDRKMAYASAFARNIAMTLSLSGITAGGRLD